MYYLYIKTHKSTQLKYLGFTSCDPFKYKGSGKYWKNHIKKHGYDVYTQILLATENKDDIKRTGLFFSNLFAIVKSSEWANLTEESAYGGATFTGKTHTKETKKKMSEAKKGKPQRIPFKGIPQSPEKRKKISETLKSKRSGKDNPAYGKRWWNNGKINKFLSTSPSSDWKLGRLKWTTS